MTPDVSAVVRWPRELAAAGAFLTRLPIGRFVDVDARAVAAAAPLYPAVGAALGAVAGLVERGLSPWLPPFIVAALLTSLLAGLTGAMHLDGLADTADALGGRSREDSLRIMRDHVVGAFGASALVLALVLKVAVVAALIETDEVVAGLVAACACSRAVAAPLAAALPYARESRQVGVPEQIGLWRAVVGLLVAASIAVAAAGAAGAVVLLAACAVAAAAGVLYRRWLGGVTGDTLGAVVELGELAALTTAVAIL
jgi:adenosylcobinamide-GDP ribazoletransferase